MELYKGFIKTKGKKPVEKFEDCHPLKDVKDLPEYAGVLADNVILIDIDDKEQSEILMDIVEDLQLDCIVRQTTRGRHFLFKNSGVNSCGTHKKLACGLTADIKVGLHNSTQQIKLDGEERFIEWDCKEPQDLPKWLFPVSSKVDFFNMDEGDGRNSALYSYILNLTQAGFSKDETRQTLEIINKYILKEPLGDDELELITRDEAFPKETFYNGKAFLHNNFAVFLKNNDDIKRIQGQLHIYDNGAYVSGTREIEYKMVEYLPMLKAAQRSEVLKYLDIICPSDTPTADAKLIAFNNGVYDITTGVLQPFSPDIVITNKIPHNYNPAAYSELADKTLDKLACGDKTIRALLEECIGYTFYRRNELSKAFVLTGDKSNGKSTFLDVVKNVLGQDNYSALDLAELDERFSVATMAGKLANIGDDISDDFLQGRSISNFKKIVSGNQIKAEFKGQDAFFFNPYVKLLFSANDIPRMKDKTGAVLRRLVIVPFNAKFSKDDPDYDPFITWKLRDESVMEYIVKIAVEGLKRILINNSFTESVKVEKELEEYEVQNNPILLFLQEHEEWEFLNQPTKDIHRMYKVFCVENGFGEMTLSNFSRELNKRLGIVVKRLRVNGKLTGIYVKGE